MGLVEDTEHAKWELLAMPKKEWKLMATTPPVQWDEGIERERKRRAVYQALAQAPEWPLVLADLMAQSHGLADPVVRSGWLQAVIHMQESTLLMEE